MNSNHIKISSSCSCTTRQFQHSFSTSRAQHLHNRDIPSADLHMAQLRAVISHTDHTYCPNTNIASTDLHTAQLHAMISHTNHTYCCPTHPTWQSLSFSCMISSSLNSRFSAILCSSCARCLDDRFCSARDAVRALTAMSLGAVFSTFPGLLESADCSFWACSHSCLTCWAASLLKRVPTLLPGGQASNM